MHLLVWASFSANHIFCIMMMYLATDTIEDINEDTN